MNWEYIGCEYEEFPHSTAMSEGINIIPMVEEQKSCRVLTNEIYRTVDGVALSLQIILPTQNKKETRRYPLIVFVQGSNWGKQCVSRELAQLSRFAERGYVIAIVEYRHSEIAAFPAQIIDTKYAIDYMVKNAEKYMVDPSRIILWGDSSGGHTTLMAAFTKGNQEFGEAELEEHEISCVISYYPSVDLPALNEEPSAINYTAPDSPVGKLLGNVQVTKENGKKTVVTNYIKKDQNLPPVIIFHGSKDRTVPFKQSVILYDKLKDCNQEVICYQIYGADHGGSPFWTKAVFDIIENFLINKLADN